MADIKVPLLRPYMNDDIKRRVMETMDSQFVGQGPRVDEFEKEIGHKFGIRYPIAVNSGTSALDLAYDIVGIKEGSKVYTPVLTCTATNIPLLRRGAKLVFMDIDPITFNPVIPADYDPTTDFVVSIDHNGIKNDIKADVHDAAQATGVTHDSGITIYSFQAVKQFTTADGVLLALRNEKEYREAKLKRWFGIDREAKARNDYQPYKNREMVFNIEMLGYKYQMNDIAAAMGLGGLATFEGIMAHRKEIYDEYQKQFAGLSQIKIIDGDNKHENYHYTLGVLVNDRDNFAKMLLENGVDSNIVELRNDIYELFGGKRQEHLVNMNALEEMYLFLPCNHLTTVEHVQMIGDLVRKGW